MNQDELLQEILRLTKDNNRLLHAARRNAWIGGILKFVVYFVLIVALPLWLYMTYLAPVLESTLETMNKIQGTGASAQAQFSDLQNLLKGYGFGGE